MQMKTNYRAWEIDFDEFHRQMSDAGRLRFLMRFAVLAPSSHNSQPWRFEVGESKIIVRPDMRRSLPKSDTNHRQLFISLGCAIENLIVAADYYGFATQTDYQDDEAVISFQRVRREPSQDAHHLIFSILKRHTNRNPYDDRMPDEQFLGWMRGLANDEMRIDCIIDQSIKNKIADITIAAGIAAMDDRGFREELSHYVKSNITKAKTGMPGLGFGMPTPLSLIASFMLKRFNMSKLSRKQDRKLLTEQTPVMAVISTKEDDKKSRMQVGQLYERIALTAEKDGIKTAPMAAAIQIGNFYQELQRILGVSSRPQMFFRLGYSAKLTPHSPRLSEHEVVRE
ncbi:MAG: hypothetical protein WAP52_03410 [Candidatus Sungiibacteriota bacterium]